MQEDGTTQELFEAIRSKKLFKLQEIINSDSKYLSTKQNGSTILHLCCWHGFDEGIKLLIQHKADPLSLNSFNENPLHYACKLNHSSAVDIVLNELKCNRVEGMSTILLSQDTWLATPLHNAIRNLARESVITIANHCREMLEHQIHEIDEIVNIQDAEGDTILHEAVLSNDIIILQNVLSLFPNPYIENEEGISPVDLIKNSNDILQEIKFVFEEYLHQTQSHHWENKLNNQKEKSNEISRIENLQKISLFKPKNKFNLENNLLVIFEGTTNNEQIMKQQWITNESELYLILDLIKNFYSS